MTTTPQPSFEPPAEQAADALTDSAVTDDAVADSGVADDAVPGDALPGRVPSGEAPDPGSAPVVSPEPLSEPLSEPLPEPLSEPLPEAPEHPRVDPEMARVEMFGEGGLDWQPVSPRLITTRTITLLAWLVPMLIAAVGAALLVSEWLWIAAAALLLLIVWGLWLIRRQVSAMSYLELSEDLVIRKGRLFRQVSSIPYGRLQYVDLQSGPLERKYGMATLQIFTASPSTSATLPGLPVEIAEQMRGRLMRRGEAQRAGL